MEHTICISLGWRCKSAMYSVDNGYRKTKANGYNTCPFDLMISNYDGLIECINDDFHYFCDTNYLELRTTCINSEWKGETFIYNKKYKFIFNHESPGHANLYVSENWSEGKEHYINNNYRNFLERYTNRINNFRNYINHAIETGDKVLFVIERFKANSENSSSLLMALKNRYPLLNFEIKFIDFTDNYLYMHLTTLMGCDESSDEVQRLDDSCKKL